MHECLSMGQQFKVFCVGKRVYKVPNTREEIAEVFRTQHDNSTKNPDELERKVIAIERERDRIMARVKDTTIDLSILGNPVFQSDGSYYQDKVTPLGKVISAVYVGGGIEAVKPFIDSYVESIFQYWQNGFTERVFNLTINNGVNKAGKVILMDFGEISFRREDAKEDIESKRWEKSWSFRRDMLPAVRDYYANQMNAQMTSLNLDTYWRRTSVLA